MTDLRLVIFDVDGTLVDSQGDIVAAMTHAFETAGARVPDRATILSIVGLSLPQAMARLAPGVGPQTQARMVDWYKEAYMHLRAESGAAQSSPLYPYARDTLDALNARPETLLGVATGKSRRGLDKLLDGHDLRAHFVTQQVSDHHPSKPHPSMILTALAETGVAAQNAVMIGDTTFDMEMARAAGVPFIGVGWGYHPADHLTGAQAILRDFRDLPGLIDTTWERTA
ncbi:HAD-IA family hydrolase [Roseovarius aestuariivivens]|uniref:HAD-IA family hydrolase n=1 Tax=Roseovarius aestuariivivens TaxID=1888910 RepID=UPI001081B23B|nr:HAD-IA family hydrolase [Roseovarius aestuariivivens]